MFKSPATFGRGFLSVRQPSDGSAPPASVQWAVKLMQAGAAVSTVYLIFALAVTATVKGSLTTWNAEQAKSKQLTAAQINSIATFYIVSAIVTGLVAIALWIWMAKVNSAGRNWARITASVFFVLWSLYTYNSLGGTRGAATLIISTVIVLVIWLIGLGALFMLWRQESTAFFRAQSAR
jgi:hypothetical protein